MEAMQQLSRQLSVRVLAAVLLLAALGCAPTTGPIVPILPPLTISTPDVDGNVSIDGDSEPDAQVFAFNEARGEGVIGTADGVGRYQLVLGADVGDDISVWQRVGTEDSPPRIATVPGP